MNLINLFVNFVSCGVVGHIKVENLSVSESASNPGLNAEILARKVFLVFLNLLQTSRKCCSVSTKSNVVVFWFIGLLGDDRQKVQRRSLNGVTGLVRRSTSVARECALIRRRVRADLWFRFLTQLI